MYNFCHLFHSSIPEDLGHAIIRMVFKYNQNVLPVILFTSVQNQLLYYSQPFHCLSSVQCLGHDCQVEYTKASHGIIPQSYNIRVS